MCPSIYTRGHIRAIHYAAPVAHTHAHTCTHSDALTTRMCVACTALATHTEIYTDISALMVFADVASVVSPSVLLSLSLSLSIHQETRGERIIRALFEMDFIRAAQSRDDTRVYTQEGMFNCY